MSKQCRPWSNCFSLQQFSFLFQKWILNVKYSFLVNYLYSSKILLFWTNYSSKLFLFWPNDYTVPKYSISSQTTLQFWNIPFLNKQLQSQNQYKNFAGCHRQKCLFSFIFFFCRQNFNFLEFKVNEHTSKGTTNLSEICCFSSKRGLFPVFPFEVGLPLKKEVAARMRILKIFSVNIILHGLHILILRFLWASSADEKTDDIFYFSQKIGDNLHEMPNPIFWEK